MKVLVSGGRDYNDRAHVFAVLDVVHQINTITCVVHGACGANADEEDCGVSTYKGADRWAHLWAEKNSVPVKPYPARWTTHGAVAGQVRNKQMFDEEQPDLVLCFPGGNGTAHMFDYAISHAMTSHRGRLKVKKIGRRHESSAW